MAKFVSSFTGSERLAYFYFRGLFNFIFYSMEICHFILRKKHFLFLGTSLRKTAAIGILLRIYIWNHTNQKAEQIYLHSRYARWFLYLPPNINMYTYIKYIYILCMCTLIDLRDVYSDKYIYIIYIVISVHYND